MLSEDRTLMTVFTYLQTKTAITIYYTLIMAFEVSDRKKISVLYKFV